MTADFDPELVDLVFAQFYQSGVREFFSTPHKGDLMKTVQLIPAFQWDCPDCGSVHYVKPEFPDLSDEEREELIKQFEGVDAIEELPPEFMHDIFTVPENLVCSECWEKFDVDASSI